MNGIVVKFPQDSPAIVHISLGTMNVKYEMKKSLTLFDAGGADLPQPYLRKGSYP